MSEDSWETKGPKEQYAMRYDTTIVNHERATCMLRAYNGRLRILRIHETDLTLHEL